MLVVTFAIPTTGRAMKLPLSRRGILAVDAVHIPLNEACWNGESYVPSADAGANYQNAVKAYVSLLNTNGIVAVMDLQWTDGQHSGPSSGCSSSQATCLKPMPDAAQAIPFWISVANTFKGNNATGLRTRLPRRHGSGRGSSAGHGLRVRGQELGEGGRGVGRVSVPYHAKSVVVGVERTVVHAGGQQPELVARAAGLPNRVQPGLVAGVAGRLVGDALSGLEPETELLQDQRLTQGGSIGDVLGDPLGTPGHRVGARLAGGILAPALRIEVNGPVVDVRQCGQFFPPHAFEHGVGVVGRV